MFKVYGCTRLLAVLLKRLSVSERLKYGFILSSLVVDRSPNVKCELNVLQALTIVQSPPVTVP